MIDEETSRGYPLPNAANLLSEDVERLRGATERINNDVTQMLLAIALKANLQHNHPIGEISGLTEALAGKLNADSQFTLGGLSDVSDAVAANNQVLMWVNTQWSPVSLQVGHIAGLETQMAALATATAAKLDAAALSNATAKSAPVDTDTFNLIDTVLRKITWANIKATLKSYFDGIYPPRERALAIPPNTEVATVDVNTLTTPGWHPLLVIGTQPNGWGTADYGYLFNAVYAGGGGVTQFVLPYLGGRMRYRMRYEGTWQKWEELRIGKETVSSAAPSGGADGDVWLQV